MQLRGLLPVAFAALAAAAEPLTAVLKANNDTLSTFKELLATAPEFSKVLASSKDFTILAPSNDAFAKAMQMDPTLVQKATNVTFVTDLLSYHVVTGKTMDSMFSAKPRFVTTFYETPTANVTGAQKVELVEKSDKAVVFSGFKQMSTIIQSDISFSGGVLHVIDSVLTFPGTLFETAMNTGLTSMAGALMRAKMVNDIDSLQAATVFAPTNDAFQSVGGTVASMQPQDLAKILQYHVLTNQVRFSTGVTTKMAFKSLMGSKVTLRKEGEIFANSAKVTIGDIITSDGVMHVVDSVLNPEAPKLAPKTKTPAFDAAVAADRPPFADTVQPTANFVLTTSAVARSVNTRVSSAVLGFLMSAVILVL
ncbi:Fasciclin-like arabinogalactan protein [Colletotrichum spinosum]|uniref:Fasciclin-like arabinogalactan protein n=1 Tax=Colletotrichum spinosum TaxID=1347390 RepID=A0A4R8QID7_9PEZI|nr:Fasciclin-like arabinogalactan protein [Colletotrichum spinosum]